MTAVISESLYNEIMKSAKEKYPTCAENIKQMYRKRAYEIGVTLSEDQLDNLVLKILGPKP